MLTVAARNSSPDFSQVAFERPPFTNSRLSLFNASFFLLRTHARAAAAAATAAATAAVVDRFC